MSVAIKVDGLSKVYTINHEVGNGRSLRETLERSARGVANWIIGRTSQPQALPDATPKLESFNALEGISFEVKRGERLGVIGRNGAGKSTLLKILSRVVEPTSGRISIQGRISSLLEVGTGFHPELTGRENIFLNGAVLGMHRQEIIRKFDEIVAFSDIEKFLDTPVKFYSSGMYVRLAFSVSAHLDPDILVLDEVLAVGDVRFQQKCLERMRVASDSGQTVIFVSHSTQAISQMCQRVLYLDNGKVRAYGDTAEVVRQYVLDSMELGDEKQRGLSGPSLVRDVSDEFVGPLLPSQAYRRAAQYRGKAEDGDDEVQLVGASVLCDGEPVESLLRDAPFEIEMAFVLKKNVGEKYVPNFHFYTLDGILAFISAPPNIQALDCDSATITARCVVPGNILNDGVYRVSLAVSSRLEGEVKIHFFASHALTFSVREPRAVVGENGYQKAVPGVFRPNLVWTTACATRNDVSPRPT
jgi:lipopolysaccharide transport system ATP-binding protein